MKTSHPQLHIEFGDMSADVDEGIADLVLSCWKRGIRTSMSCQENEPGVVWIMFSSVQDAERFLPVVFTDDGSEQDQFDLWGRALHWSDGSANGPGTWEWTIGVDYEERGRRPGPARGPIDPYFSVSVRFPQSDLPTLRERLLRGVE